MRATNVRRRVTGQRLSGERALADRLPLPSPSYNPGASTAGSSRGSEVLVPGVRNEGIDRHFVIFTETGSLAGKVSSTPWSSFLSRFSLEFSGSFLSLGFAVSPTPERFASGFLSSFISRLLPRAHITP